MIGNKIKPDINKRRWKNLSLSGEKKDCFYCFNPLASSNITMDHKIPRGLGGLDQITNKVYCCVDCNRNKSKIENRILNKLKYACSRHIDSQEEREKHIGLAADQWICFYETFNIILPIEIVQKYLSSKEVELFIQQIMSCDIPVHRESLDTVFSLQGLGQRS